MQGHHKDRQDKQPSRHAYATAIQVAGYKFRGKAELPERSHALVQHKNYLQIEPRAESEPRTTFMQATIIVTPFKEK